MGAGERVQPPTAPPVLAAFTERVLGATTTVADHSWPYDGSEVHRVRATDGTEYIVKQLQNERFFSRELTGYGWTPALGPGRAPTLVAADPEIRAVILTILPGVMLKASAGLAAEDEPAAFEQAGLLLGRLHGALEPQRETSTIDRLVVRADEHLRRAGAELTAAQRDLARIQAQSLKSLAPHMASVATHGDCQQAEIFYGTRRRADWGSSTSSGLSRLRRCATSSCSNRTSSPIDRTSGPPSCEATVVSWTPPSSRRSVVGPPWMLCPRWPGVSRTGSRL